MNLRNLLLLHLIASIVLITPTHLSAERNYLPAADPICAYAHTIDGEPIYEDGRPVRFCQNCGSLGPVQCAEMADWVYDAALLYSCLYILENDGFVFWEAICTPPA